MKPGKVIETILIFVMISILVIPGLIFIDTLAHEFYHYLQHKDMVEEFCIDFNGDTSGHIGLKIPKDSTFTREEIEREEKIAMFVGRIAAILYLINATLVFTLFFNILTRPKRK